MALTTGNVIRLELSEEARIADFRVQVVDFKGDAAYPTGGSPGVAAAFGLTRIIAMVPIIHAGYQFDYLDTDKLRMLQQSAATGALTEVPNNANLNGVTFRALLIGL